MSPKPCNELGLPTGRVDKPINVWFENRKLHETKNGALEFVVSFLLCEMDEVDLIVGDTFFETHTFDVSYKLVHLVVCHNNKKVTLKLTRTPIARGGKLNLVSLDHMKDLQSTVVVQI